MRKFAFLLAIVAVFAMSTAAFASEAGITAIGDPTGGNGANSIGTISRDLNAAADFYYIKKDATMTNLKIALSIDHDNKGKEDDALSGDFTFLKKADDNTDLALTWDSTAMVADDDTAATVAAANNVYTGEISLDQIPAQIKLSRMGFVDGSTTTAVTAPGASFTLTTVPVAVKYTGTVVNLVEDEIDPSTVHAISLGLDSVSGATIVLPKRNLEVAGAISADADYGKLIDIAVSADNTLKVSFDAAIPVGTYSFTIVAKDDSDVATEIVISDDVYKNIKIAGLADKDVLGKIAFEVQENKAKETAEEVQDAIDLLSSDPKDAINSTQLNKNGANFAILDANGEIIMLNDNVASSDVNYLGASNDINATDVVIFILDANGNVSADAKGTIDAAATYKGNTKPYDSEEIAYGVATIRIIPASVVGLFVTNSSVSAASVGAQEAVESGMNQNAYPVEMKFTSSAGYSFKPDTFKFTLGDKGGYWHSSSSSCSMGFGLAAVAGLAALALRKRSK